jgi:hypothetical protein
MTRASIAMAPESSKTAVLFYGMAGAGKTACALELAYRYASGRFEAFAWHKAPDEGHDIAGALLRLALDLERQLQGFTMAHVVDRADEFIAWLPRLTELLEQRSILIVLDNLESLLTPEGSWRDARWEAMVRALVVHGGFSRTVLTSRRRPVALGDDPSLVVEAIHALSLAEAALLARELPHLGALLRGEHAVGLEHGRTLVTHTLAVVQGHPQLLALAEAQAKDPGVLAGHLARAASAWEGGAVTLQAFFHEGESRHPAEAFLSALAGWTREVAGGLPSAPRFLFHILCALEDEDRQERVVEANWGTVWRLLGQGGEVPPLAETFSRIVEVSLIESQRTGDGETRYALHPAVAEVGRVEAVEATQAAVDRALIVWWVNLFQYGLEHEGEGLGWVVSDSARRAVPYLLRQQRWDAVVTLLERVISRDSSPATIAVVLPYLRHIAAVTASTGSRFALAKALRLASQEVEAEGLLRELIPEVDAQENVQLAAGATSELINVLQIMGRLEEALELCDAQQAYTRKAGFGRWTQLKDEGQRLQILALLGRAAEVLTAVEALRDELRTLPEVSSQQEAVDPWNARELILDAGHTAALNLGHWEDVLALNAELIALNEARGASALEVASTRFNDYSPLLRLGRTAEAATLLHACRAVFEAAGDLKLLTLLFTALADLEVARDHPEAAITFEKTALRYSYRIGDARACATAHFNLADDLRRAGGSPAVALAHRLATGVIEFQTGDGRLARTLRVLARDCADFAPEPPTLPASFDALCALAEQVEGVLFREMVERLPRRVPSGEAALTEVLRLVQEQFASATEP